MLCGLHSLENIKINFVFLFFFGGGGEVDFTAKCLNNYLAPTTINTYMYLNNLASSATKITKYLMRFWQ